MNEDQIEKLVGKAGMYTDLMHMGAAPMVYSPGCQGVNLTELKRFVELVEEHASSAALLAHLEAGDKLLSDAVRDALTPTSNLSFERMALILDEDPYGDLSGIVHKEAARTLRRCAKAEAVWGGAARASDALKP